MNSIEGIDDPSMYVQIFKNIYIYKQKVKESNNMLSILSMKN